MMRLFVFLSLCVISGSGWRIYSIRSSSSLRTEITSQCLQQAVFGSCDFYTCLEARFPCGADGFAIKIGKHFCERGLAIRDQLTFEGRRFFNEFMSCQTNSLLSVYQSYSTLTCPVITDRCVSSMLSCSQRVFHGLDFCGFVRTNAAAYNRLYGYEEISRLVSLGRPTLISQLFTGGSTCGSRAVTYRFNTMTGSFSDFLTSVRTSWNTCRDRVTMWFRSF